MSEIDKFKNQLGEKIELLLEHFCAESDLVEPLKSALHYSLFPKGKRIRPLFALAIAHDLGVYDESLILPALSLELVHASSLVHDDLPALDNDDYRRGQLSCHKKFGEATAILVGDLLIAAAFSLVSQSMLESATTQKMSSILSQAFIDVCHGQQRDLIHGKERGSLELLHRLKTGALFRAAAQFGALSYTQEAELITRFAELGEQIGIYFQLVDDLLDLSGKEDLKGRPSGSDKRNSRETFGDQSNAELLQERKEKLADSIISNLEKIEAQTERKLELLRGIFSQIQAQI